MAFPMAEAASTSFMRPDSSMPMPENMIEPRKMRTMENMSGMACTLKTSQPTTIIMAVSMRFNKVWLRTFPRIHSILPSGVIESRFIMPLLLNSVVFVVTPMIPLVMIKAAMTPGR